jgi:hypothetical protein
MKSAARRPIAYHEAGHAVIAWHLGVRVRSLTIVPDEATLGRCHHASLIRGRYPELDGSLGAVVKMQKNIMISLAGPIAQHLYNPHSVRRYHTYADHTLAADLALQLTESEEESGALLKWLEIRTRGILRLRWALVESLGKKLLDTGTMKGTEVGQLLQETMSG